MTHTELQQLRQRAADRKLIVAALLQKNRKEQA
jgi:hypothetical protein